MPDLRHHASHAISGALFAGHPSTRRVGSLAGPMTIDRFTIDSPGTNGQALHLWERGLPSLGAGLPSPAPGSSDGATGHLILSKLQDLERGTCPRREVRSSTQSTRWWIAAFTGRRQTPLGAGGTAALAQGFCVKSRGSEIGCRQGLEPFVFLQCVHKSLELGIADQRKRDSYFEQSLFDLPDSAMPAFVDDPPNVCAGGTTFRREFFNTCNTFTICSGMHCPSPPIGSPCGVVSTS